MGAQTVPPPPPVPVRSAAATQAPTIAPAPTDVPSPSPSPAPRGRKGRPKPALPEATTAPEPSATPTSPAFATLDGTWEVQLQYIDRTEYSYFTLVQAPTGALSGVWKVGGKTYPLDGTYDGRLIRIVVKEPTTDVTISGYVEGASDMVGTMDLMGGKTDPTAFTAEHRPSSKGSIFKKGA